MKSLEHTIRLVHEGKCCGDKKKKSLENTIRTMKKESRRDDIDASLGKVAAFDKMATENMEYMGSGTGGEPKLHAESGKKKKLEEIGVVGTDKFQGPQFTTRQTVTPVIKPGHNEQADKASNARNITKVSRSPSMQNKIAEASILGTIAKGSVKTKVPSLKLPPLEPEKIKLPPLKLPPLAPEKTEVPAAVSTAPKTVPATVPSAAGKTEAPATLPQTQTKVEAPTKTGVTTKTIKPTEIPTTAATLPKTVTPTETPTKTATPTIPKVPVVTTTEPKVAAVPKVPTGPAEPPSGKTPPVGPKGKGFVPFPFTPKGLRKGDFLDILHLFRPPTITHRAKPRMAHESVDQERKKIENMPKTDDNRKNVHYVGRKEDEPKTIKSKTARNAELKNKILDEGKKISSLIKQVHKKAKDSAKEYKEDGKTKVYPNVIINPDLNRVDLNTYIDSGKTPNDYK